MSSQLSTIVGGATGPTRQNLCNSSASRLQRLPLSAHPEATAAQIENVIDELVQLYENWGKPDEAEKWRKQKENQKTRREQPERLPDSSFIADAVVDGQDFIIWNANKFTSSDAGSGGRDAAQISRRVRVRPRWLDHVEGQDSPNEIRGHLGF